MKWAEKFTVGKLLRGVPCIKFSNPESLFNFIYDEDMLNLVINEKNLFFCCIGIKGKIHPSYFVKSVIMIITL
jgi:hypothetical protein